MLSKTLVHDLQAGGGLVLEKIEGLAVTAEGDALVVNANDGVDGSMLTIWPGLARPYFMVLSLAR